MPPRTAPSTADASTPTDAGHPARSTRLIERWLPIAELGVESVRERTPMTPYPAPNRLHVWWARRPLVASRAAILASLLPEDADQDKFMHILGIHGDPVTTRAALDEAKRTGENLGTDPYGYKRAFTYTPKLSEKEWLQANRPNGDAPIVLDPTAGGGSIPFEAIRCGYTAIANDLNPVAWLILKATVEFPARFGSALVERYNELTARFMELAEPRFVGFFPPEPNGDPNVEKVTVDGYLWARTVSCPYCGGVVPLSPNWKLNNKGTGVRLVPVTDADRGRADAVPVMGGRRSDAPDRFVAFEIVHTAAEQSEGTVKGGQGKCPFPDCGRVIDGDEIKQQAQAGHMGEQLYAVVYKQHRVTGYTASGKPKIKKQRGFRAPRPQDEVGELIQRALDDKMPEWQARNIVPEEEILEGNKTLEPIRYGMTSWKDLFSPRQLLGHCTSVEVFHDLIDELGGPGGINKLDSAACTYLAIATEKLLNWNARLSSWNVKAQRLRSVFDRHDFAFKWSFGEMATTITGVGYDWAFRETGKCIEEMSVHQGWQERPRRSSSKRQGELHHSDDEPRQVRLDVTADSAAQLNAVEDLSVDAVVIDPPYYDNVMYAELSDFFYVWLKRTAGLLYPEAFGDQLTDKDREAVANPAKFKEFKQVKGSGGVKRRAHRDYQERMQAIFAECRRVLKPDGVMTLMFTHKASGAWDALAKGLVDAGFVITASWPVATEAEGSLHIKDKNAAKSTIFLVCRPRAEAEEGTEAVWWEEVEPKVTQMVRKRVEYYQSLGMAGVDLYLSCFGPALQVFSENWPMRRGRPLPKPEPAKGAQLKLTEDEDFDPYAVRPEDALMAARSAVKAWRLEQLTKVQRRSHVDAVTEWVVLAWDAFKAAKFPADEALKLARVVGVSFDGQLRGKVLEVVGGDVVLWDSQMRSKKGSMGGLSQSVMIDALHHAAATVRERNLDAARSQIEAAGLHDDPTFKTGLELVLNVLPLPGVVTTGPVAGAAEDARALEQLRQLLFADVPQTEAWRGLFGQAT